MQNFIPLYSQEEEKKEKNEGPIKGILQITEYSNALKEREEALKQAKIISGQIADLSNDMRYEVIKQGEKLDEIDDNMLAVDENVEKGLNELKQIEVITRASKKRLYCLITLLFIVLGVILYYVIQFIRGNNK
jgi:t-SNARE complex subunit (syntaxin)